MTDDQTGRARRPTVATFRSIGKDLTKVAHEIDQRRILTSFEDFDSLVELYEREAPTAPPKRPLVDEDEPTVRAWLAAARKADVLHKAIIQFACIAVNVLLHEVLPHHPRRGKSVAFLLARPWASDLTHADCWADLYRLTVYRNKIIVHHDVPRMGGSMAEASGVRRLVPLPKEFHLAARDVAQLKEIRDALRMRDAPENDFELLDHLFRTCPIVLGGQVTQERIRVDQIVERGGVKSFSVAEINSMLCGAASDALLVASASRANGATSPE